MIPEESSSQNANTVSRVIPFFPKIIYDQQSDPDQNTLIPIQIPFILSPESVRFVKRITIVLHSERSQVRTGKKNSTIFHHATPNTVAPAIANNKFTPTEKYSSSIRLYSENQFRTDRSREDKMCLSFLNQNPLFRCITKNRQKIHKEPRSSQEQPILLLNQTRSFLAAVIPIWIRKIAYPIQNRIRNNVAGFLTARFRLFIRLRFVTYNNAFISHHRLSSQRTDHRDLSRSF